MVINNGSLSLNNGGDTVTITSAEGEVLATASYDGPSDQSVTRAVELDDTSELVAHTSINGALRASPATRADGSDL